MWPLIGTPVHAVGERPHTPPRRRGVSLPWWSLRSAAPAPPAVEQQGTAGGDAIPPTASPPVVWGYCGNDPFADDDHDGSPDLSLWPPSRAERELALKALDGEKGAAGALRRECLSPMRAMKIRHLMLVERAAHVVIETIKGGPGC